MKVIVAATRPMAANIVRGALQSVKAQNMTVVTVNSPDQVAKEIADDSVVLVDWEDEHAVATVFIAAARKASEKTPILLLCPKAMSGSTFPGMKAGATGVLNKPFEAEELVKALAGAQKIAQARKPALNVEFVNPFIDATANVFRTMAGMEIERKKLFLKTDHKLFGDVSGVMGLSGTANGSVVVSLPEKLACVVVGKLLGEAPPAQLTPDVCDAVAELINMIAGQAKVALVKTKYHFQLSIPSVVKGAGHEITHKQGTPCIVILFGVEGMEFVIQVSLAPGGEAV